MTTETTENGEAQQNREPGCKGCLNIIFIFQFPIALIIAGIFFPETIPFKIFGFWNTSKAVDGIIAGWPMLIWTLIVNFLGQFIIRNLMERNPEIKAANDASIAKSLATHPGYLIATSVFEELAFRWIMFLGGIPLLKIINHLFFGFAGIGIPERLHIYIIGPIADFTTFGYLNNFLFHEHGWAVGASLLSANAVFRDGHKYQGWFGYFNAWFAGMYFFYIALNYSLLSAIAIHIACNYITLILIRIYEHFQEN